jgi:hypothetical protein
MTYKEVKEILEQKCVPDTCYNYVTKDQPRYIEECDIFLNEDNIKYYPRVSYMPAYKSYVTSKYSPRIEIKLKDLKIEDLYGIFEHYDREMGKFQVRKKIRDLEKL